MSDWFCHCVWDEVSLFLISLFHYSISKSLLKIPCTYHLFLQLQKSAGTKEILEQNIPLVFLLQLTLFSTASLSMLQGHTDQKRLASHSAWLYRPAPSGPIGFCPYSFGSKSTGGAWYLWRLLPFWVPLLQWKSSTTQTNLFLSCMEMRWIPIYTGWWTAMGCFVLQWPSEIGCTIAIGVVA